MAVSQDNVRPQDHPLKAAVIGHPIAQSLSPVLHQHWFEETGLEGNYQALDVRPEDLEQTVHRLRGDGYAGFNVTMPHKEAILPFLDKLAPSARSVGAVNTVKINENGTLSGFNTDVPGLMAHLNATAPGWAKDKPALLLGAGGAARAGAAGLIAAGVPLVMITNRTRAKAEAVAKAVGQGRMTVVDWEDRHTAVTAAGLILNCTLLGMTGQASLELDLKGAGPDTTVYDIVYKPLETPLLAAAHAQGLKTVDGLGMLIQQGAAAFKIWFGHTVGDSPSLRSKIEARLKAEAP